MGGIEQNWFGIGKTTLYGEYARMETGAGLTSGGTVNNSGGPNAGFAGIVSNAANNTLVNSEVNIWGLGINQEISAAAMDMYVSYRHFDMDARFSANGLNTATSQKATQDFQAVMMGAIIRF